MSKSAQGLSLSTIVIGAIVLIVLVVLVGVFSGFFGNRFVPGFSAATEQKCENVKDECDELTEEEVFGNFGRDLPQGQKCCRKLTVLCEGPGIACKTACESGESKLDKNIDGLDYVCQDTKKYCCLLRF